MNSLQILKRYSVKSVILLFTLTIMFSCRQAQNNTNAGLVEEEEEEQLGFGTEEQLEEVFYRFPAPEEMLNFFEDEEFSFTPHILQPTEKSKQFLDSRSQAFNLGVYMSDLAYLTIFKQSQESHEYMLAIYNMTEKLRISSAFDFSLIQRMENNIGSMDSLKAISYIAMNKLNTYLEKNHKESTFLLISIGGYIESMYLSFNLVGDFTEGNPFIQRISDQKYVLTNLINFGLRYSDDPQVSEAIELLLPIRSKFNEIVVKKTPTKVEKDSTGTLQISGGNKYEITEEQYGELRQMVFNTRQKITQYQ